MHTSDSLAGRPPSWGKSTSASWCAYAGRSLRPLFSITPIPRQARSAISKTSSTTRCAATFPSRTTARTYWFSTSVRPSSSCRTSIRIPSSRSIGSNPVTTSGTPKSRAIGSYSRHPWIAHT